MRRVTQTDLACLLADAMDSGKYHPEWVRLNQAAAMSNLTCPDRPFFYFFSPDGQLEVIEAEPGDCPHFGLYAIEMFGGQPTLNDKILGQRLALDFIGWGPAVKLDEVNLESYNVTDFFDGVRYLGPDLWGVYPIWSL